MLPRKGLVYQVNVGSQSNLYDWCNNTVLQMVNRFNGAYSEEITLDYHCEKKPLLKIKPNPKRTNRSLEAVERLGYLPIFEKQKSFDFFYDGYHGNNYDFLIIIDSDICMFHKNLKAMNLFHVMLHSELTKFLNEDIEFAACYEANQPSLPWHQKKVQSYTKMQHGSFPFYTEQFKFFQCGLMILSRKAICEKTYCDSAYEFVMREDFVDFVDGVGNFKWSTDQTLMNYWVKVDDLKTMELNWRMNGLYGALPNDKLQQAEGIHFFLKDKLPDRGENIETLKKELENLKNNYLRDQINKSFSII